MTPVRAVARRAARVLLVDDDGRVLLFAGGDPGRPQAGTWWFTPGGGVDPGEDEPAAAVREVAEETGLRLDDVGPVVHRRRTRFEFDGVLYDQDESYFLVRRPAYDVRHDGWNDVERRAMVGHRWWPRAELRTTAETVYPVELPVLLDRLAPVPS